MSERELHDLTRVVTTADFISNPQQLAELYVHARSIIALTRRTEIAVQQCQEIYNFAQQLAAQSPTLFSLSPAVACLNCFNQQITNGGEQANNAAAKIICKLTKPNKRTTNNMLVNYRKPSREALLRVLASNANEKYKKQAISNLTTTSSNGLGVFSSDTSAKETIELLKKEPFCNIQPENKISLLKAIVNSKKPLYQTKIEACQQGLTLPIDSVSKREINGKLIEFLQLQQKELLVLSIP